MTHITNSVHDHRMLMAEWTPTPHTFGWMRPTLIVVHETGTRIDKGAAVKYCTAPKSVNPIRVGYHIIIERDGTIVQLARFDQKVRHAGRSSWKGRKWCNAFSIGIGLVGPTELKGTAEKAKSFYGKWFDSGDGIVAADSPYHGKGHIWLRYTAEQLVALDEVVAELRDAYPGIDLAGHYHVSPSRKIDPSPLLNFSNVGKLDEQVPTQDGLTQHDLAHAKDQIDEPPAPIAKADDTGKILAKSSREYRTTNYIKGMAAAGVTSTGIMEIASASNITSVKSYLDIVTGFVAAYGVPLLVGGCVFVWGAAELVQYYKRQSYDSGLYAPSGDDDA